MPVAPILNRLSVQPVAAWSAGRVLKSGAVALSGSAASLTAIKDQVGTNDLTPVGFTALATDTANGLAYALMDGVNDCLSFTSITLGATAEIYAALAPTGTVSGVAVLGRDTFSAPYIRQNKTQALIRNSSATVATVTGAWALTGFHYFRYVIDGTNFKVYVDGELWGSAAFANVGLGMFDRVGQNQGGNFYAGGLGEVVIFNQNLGAGDEALLSADGEAAWRTPFYIAGDGVGSNSAAGWSPERAWANFDLLNAASNPVPLRPGASVKVKYGAVMRRSPLYIIAATQAGSAAKRNSVTNYGDPATGPARFIVSTAVTGPWTLVGGTKYSTPLALASVQRVHWCKAGYNPQALVEAAEAAYAAAGPNQLVNFAACYALQQPLAVAASSGAVGANAAYSDGTTLYVDIGKDPTGENIEVVAQGSMVAGRALQTSREYWDMRIWASLEGAHEDGIAFSGSHSRIGGESANRRLIVIGAGGDAVGGKGGTNHVGQYITGMMAGVGPALLGSNGDGYSWHGSSPVPSYLIDCDAWLCDKSGFDHEQGTVIHHTRCRAAGCNQNYQVLNQSGGTGAFSYTDCEGKFAANDSKEMFQFHSSTPATAVFSGGHFYGSTSATINTFARVLSGCTMSITGQTTRTGFTTDINNQSGGATVDLN